MNDRGWHSTALEALEKQLERTIAGERLSARLRAALSYAVFPPGKRIRPLFAFASVIDLGGDYLDLVPAAASIELLHCSSLIHDDLPALDNDDMRRGRPSCHRAHGEAVAILTGDAAVSIAWECCAAGDLPAARRLSIGAEISSAFTLLCNGQEEDLTAPAASDALLAMYAKKTGALFGAACAAGAIGAGADAGVVTACRNFGTSLGVLFQLRDDRIDASPEKGRNESSDSRNNKAVAAHRFSAAELDSARRAAADTLDIIETKTNKRLTNLRELAAAFLG